MAEESRVPLESKEKSKVFTTFILILLILALLAAGAFGYWLYSQNRGENTEPQQSPSLLPQQSLEPGGSSVESSPVVLPSEEASPAASSAQASPEVSSLETQLKQAFADKYSKQLAEVDLEVSDNDGTYAKGLVKFSGDISGGWWLAYSNGSTWTLVADGNGTVMCTDIEDYNFPNTLVPECWDEASQSLIVR
jgi:flagellar basal body-associated protein FliL